MCVCVFVCVCMVCACVCMCWCVVCMCIFTCTLRSISRPIHKMLICASSPLFVPIPCMFYVRTYSNLSNSSCTFNV